MVARPVRDARRRSPRRPSGSTSACSSPTSPTATLRSWRAPSTRCSRWRPDGCCWASAPARRRAASGRPSQRRSAARSPTRRRHAGRCSPSRSPRCGRSGPARRSPASTSRWPRRSRSPTVRRCRRSSSGPAAATRSASAASTPTASTSCPTPTSPSGSSSLAATPVRDPFEVSAFAALDVDHPLGGDPTALAELGVDRRTLYVGAPFPLDGDHGAGEYAGSSSRRGAMPAPPSARSNTSRNASVDSGTSPLTRMHHVTPSGRRTSIVWVFSTVPVCPHDPSGQTTMPSP